MLGDGAPGSSPMAGTSRDEDVLEVVTMETARADADKAEHDWSAEGRQLRLLGQLPQHETIP